MVINFNFFFKDAWWNILFSWFRIYVWILENNNNDSLMHTINKHICCMFNNIVTIFKETGERSWMVDHVQDLFPKKLPVSMV